jgi:toxin CcdB
MARYDLFRDSDQYLLDVQADALDHLDTCVVIPVRRPEDAPKPARRLNPSVMIDGKQFILVTQFATAIRRAELGERTGNLSRHHDEIVAALDMLFQGF